MLKDNELTDNEQRFLHARRLSYMEPEHDDDFFGNRDGRSRAAWARDKAWDDVINIGKFEKEA